MTFGFETKLVGNKSTQGLKVLAESLRESLKYIRSSCTLWENGKVLSTSKIPLPTVPLIFIAHSLGGLVVKQVKVFILAYVGLLADIVLQVMLDKFVKSIYGALFFGVPSQGMDVDSLRLMVKDQPNELLLLSLQHASDTLKTQSRDFDKDFPNDMDGKIAYFYETSESPTAQCVSCKLGIGIVLTG
jgi:hypothetical protein